jgi:tetratricopeptide (TPR) repeat protein
MVRTLDVLPFDEGIIYHEAIATADKEEVPELLSLSCQRFLAAIENAPDNAMAYNLRGITLRRLGDIPAASASYVAAINSQPEFPEVRFVSAAFLFNSLVSDTLLVVSLTPGSHKPWTGVRRRPTLAVPAARVGGEPVYAVSVRCSRWRDVRRWWPAAGVSRSRDIHARVLLQGVRVVKCVCGCVAPLCGES